MTVAELIAVLNDRNPDAEVVLRGVNVCAPVAAVIEGHVIADGRTDGVWTEADAGTIGSVPAVLIEPGAGCTVSD